MHNDERTAHRLVVKLSFRYLALQPLQPVLAQIEGLWNHCFPPPSSPRSIPCPFNNASLRLFLHRTTGFRLVVYCPGPYLLVYTPYTSSARSRARLVVKPPSSCFPTPSTSLLPLPTRLRPPCSSAGLFSRGTTTLTLVVWYPGTPLATLPLCRLALPLRGPEGPLGATVYAHEYQHIGSVGYLSQAQILEEPASRREASSLSTFFMTTLLLPALLVALVERDICIPTVANPFYAALLDYDSVVCNDLPSSSYKIYNKIVKMIRSPTIAHQYSIFNVQTYQTKSRIHSK